MSNASKFWRARGIRRFVLRLRADFSLQVPIPEPGPNDVLVKIRCCGLCHTDVHSVTGDWCVKPSLPLCPGHEGVGYVAKVGRVHLTASYDNGGR